MSAGDAIRARLRHTDRRLERLRRIDRALEALQAKRRHALAQIALPVVMYDSVTLDAIPRDAPAVAGYVGGHWPTFRELAKRFPHARRVSIAVTASEDADVLDVERGDADPTQAPSWYRRQRARGLRRPCVYTSVSGMGELLRVLAHAGIPRQAVKVWTAHYTGRPHLCDHACGLPTTADATQWTDRALGRNLDESLVARSFWA